MTDNGYRSSEESPETPDEAAPWKRSGLVPHPDQQQLAFDAEAPAAPHSADEPDEPELDAGAPDEPPSEPATPSVDLAEAESGVENAHEQPAEPEDELPAPDEHAEPEPDSEAESAAWPQDDPNFRPFAAPEPSEEPEPSEPPEEGEALGQTAAAGVGVHLVDRERPPRRPFVSKRAIWITVGACAALALVVAGIVWAVAASRVTVVDYRGSSLGVAQIQAARAGLQMTVSERRFSSLAADQVLEQSPAPGMRVARGSVVTVVVSAGTEQFTMPDVTGVGIALAKGTLEARGLRVDVQTSPSQEPSGTVLMTTPGPNQPVQTGDTVRLTVSSSTSGTETLKPYRLQGAVFVLDPAPAPAAASDAPMEVARRLRALLEASGATVVTTRSAADSGTAETLRANRAKIASPTAVIGLDVAASGTGGIDVVRSTKGSLAKITSSTDLQTALVKSLDAAGFGTRTSTVTHDTVLDATTAPSSRVLLGSAASQKDTASFLDPRWSDGVSRALYQALGERYGTK